MSTDALEAMKAARIYITAMRHMGTEETKNVLAKLDAAIKTQKAEHLDDVAVDIFAGRMKFKLAQARLRGRSGWQDKSWTPEQISQALREHVEKGDPRDVANYCMFLDARGESITKPTQPSPEPPFGNCRFSACDLPGQCKAEGRCHHPKDGPPSEPQGDGIDIVPISDAEQSALYEHCKGTPHYSALRRLYTAAYRSVNEQSPRPVAQISDEQWARRFHETYERLAPQFGYETRADTKAFDPDSANGRLMIATCRALLREAPAGWRPIESAPKDGRLILSGRHGIEVAYWSSYCIYNTPKFTHWMPLPAAPKEGA